MRNPKSSHECPDGTTLFAVPVHGDAYLVTGGVIDDTAREVFTAGQCHAFAYALHEQTGWPIVAVIQPGEWSTNEDIDEQVDAATQTMTAAGLDDFASHLMCRRPDGQLVDITGAHTAAAVFDSYGVDTPMPDPLWGLMPDRADNDGHTQDCLQDGCTSYHHPREGGAESYDSFEQMLEYLALDSDGRLVGVDPQDAQRLYNRRAACEAATTLVAPLLASLT